MADERKILRLALYCRFDDAGRIVGTEASHHPEVRKRRACREKRVSGLAAAKFATVPDGGRCGASIAREFGHPSRVYVPSFSQGSLRVRGGADRLGMMNQENRHASPLRQQREDVFPDLQRRID